jgi:hypothetical protein
VRPVGGVLVSHLSLVEGFTEARAAVLRWMGVADCFRDRGSDVGFVLGKGQCLERVTVE